MACEEHSITAVLHPISTARRSMRCMSVASGVVRPAFFFSLPSRYSTVPVIATGSPAASGIEAIRYAVVVLPLVPVMPMSCGGGQGHCAAHVLDLKPDAFEIVRTFNFRDHADRALLNHLRNKLVR